MLSLLRPCSRNIKRGLWQKFRAEADKANMKKNFTETEHWMSTENIPFGWNMTTKMFASFRTTSFDCKQGSKLAEIFSIPMLLWRKRDSGFRARPKILNYITRLRKVLWFQFLDERVRKLLESFPLFLANAIPSKHWDNNFSATALNRNGIQTLCMTLIWHLKCRIMLRVSSLMRARFQRSKFIVRNVFQMLLRPRPNDTHNRPRHRHRRSWRYMASK